MSDAWPRKIRPALLLGLGFFVLHLISLQNYLLFHSVIEIASTVIAFAIFMFAWNARRHLEDDFLAFLGIAYLSVGAMDMLHTLAYKGMGVFQFGGSDLPTQLWLAGRYIQAVSWLAAVLLIGRHRRLVLAVLLQTLLAVSLLASIFWFRNFPQAFIEGVGLTPFKVYSEYAVSLVLGLSLLLLLRRAKELDRHVVRLLALSVSLTILSELSFTLYTDVYGFLNFLGHYLKILAYYALYRAIIQRGFLDPLSLMFRRLQESEASLKQEREHLEERVQERTAEVTEAEQRFRVFMDTYPGLAWIKDEQGRYVYANKQMTEMFGFEDDELLGRHASELPGIDADRIEADDEAIRETGRAIERVEDVGPAGLGRTFASTRFALPREGKPPLVAGVARDITEILAAEKAAARSERQFRELVEGANSAIVSYDSQGLVLFANPYANNLFGYPEGLQGKNVSILLPEIDEQGNSLTGLVSSITADPEQYSYHENENITRDGRRLWMTWSNRSLIDEDGRFEGVMAVGTDRTVQHEAEQELRRSQAALRRLASELSLAEERERRRIATEIHDNLSQTLAIASMKAAMLEQACGEETAAQVAELRSLLSSAVADTRSVTFELSPPILYQVGLEAAIRWLGEQTQERHGIEFHMIDDGRPRTVTEDVRTVLFQSMREIFANMIKHAKASTVTVRLDTLQNRLLARVEDDGVGFDTAKANWKSGQKAGFGLFNIQERLDYLGGSLEIDSAPGRGTRTTLTVPLVEAPTEL
ncbi:MAG: MASE3 domain-containing protein [Armatimonadota bacterium]